MGSQTKVFNLGSSGLSYCQIIKHWFKSCSSKVPFYFLAALFRDNPRMGLIHFVRELSIFC